MHPRPHPHSAISQDCRSAQRLWHHVLCPTGNLCALVRGKVDELDRVSQCLIIPNEQGQSSAARAQSLTATTSATCAFSVYKPGGSWPVISALEELSALFLILRHQPHAVGEFELARVMILVLASGSLTCKE